MEREISQLLNFISSPAFAVSHGTVTAVNAEAARLNIAPGSQIAPMLHTGQKEYADYAGGCLHLALSLSGSIFEATVRKTDQSDIFVLEQDAEQAQLQAMALAAQELREPLSNVMTVTDELFTKDGAAASTESAVLAARINRGLYQMLRLVGNMSDAYRYSRESEPQLEMRDICALWDEFWEQSAQLLSGSGITLHYTGLRESIICLVDAEKLERAASNMLSNALKFTPAGGVISVNILRRGNLLSMSLLDAGTGIPESIRSNVYSRFRRHPGIEDGRYGIGLGMVLIRRAAILHGGTVLVEQVPEQGTRITMTMQIRQNADGMVRSPIFRVDYAGERDHKLIELSESLSTDLYHPDTLN